MRTLEIVQQTLAIGYPVFDLLRKGGAFKGIADAHAYCYLGVPFTHHKSVIATSVFTHRPY